MTICLSVWFLSRITQILLVETSWKTNQRTSLGGTLIKLNFERDLNHRLDTRNNPGFPMHLFLRTLAGVFTLSVLLLYITMYI